MFSMGGCFRIACHRTMGAVIHLPLKNMCSILGKDNHISACQMMTGRVLQGFCNTFLKMVCLCIPLPTLNAPKLATLGPHRQSIFQKKVLEKLFKAV